MELDIKQFVIARERKSGKVFSELSQNSAGLGFLISQIRRELEARVTASGSRFAAGLVIDFNGSDFVSDYIDMNSHHSLLEQNQFSDNFLAGYPDQKFDCVVINLQLAWLDFQNAFSRVSRVLKPGGSFFFSSFGPDTLIEVRQAWKKIDTMPHVHNFSDMHHLGDDLLRAGFVQPIVDADWIFVDYPSVGILMRDLKAEGFTNIDSNRRKTLTGKERISDFKKIAGKCLDEQDNFRVTFEIIYGFARKSAHPDGSVLVTPPTAE